MKTIIKHFTHYISRSGLFAILGILCITIMSLSSCKKNNNEDDGSNPAATDKGILFLHLHNYLEDTDIGELPNLANTNSIGRDILISKAPFYISDIEVVKLDGTVQNFPGKRVLKTFANVLYQIGELPVGNYNIIRFKIGVDAATNAMNPTASSDSAILNKPEMWFSGTAQPDGYVFMNLQGSIDTAETPVSGNPLIPFNYKIGTNANYRQVSVSGINITVIKDQVAYAHMVADYNRFFTGIQLNNSSNLSITTTAENNSALATTIMNNIQQMFRPE